MKNPDLNMYYTKGGSLQPTGISLYSNSCFMNTIIQLLYSIPEIRLLLENLNDKNIQNIIDLSEKSDNEKHIKILLTLKNLFDKLKKKIPLIPTEKNNIYSTLLPATLKKGDQHDGPEILNYIIPSFEKKHEDTLYFIYELLNFDESHKYTCKDGNSFTKTIQNDNTYLIILPFPKDKTSLTIQKFIDNYKEKDKLEHNTTIEGCFPKDEPNLDYRESIINIPSKQKYLIIQVKRGIIDDSGMQQQLQDKIAYEDIITIDGKQFRLYGICCKPGNTAGGHYYYEIFDYNDSSHIYTVSDTSVNTLPTKTNRDEIEKTAYVFLYHKVEIVSKIVKTPTILESALKSQYLFIEIKAKRGGFQPFQNILPKEKGKEKEKIIGYDEKEQIVYQGDPRVNISPDIVKLNGNPHFTFSTFKIDETYKSSFKNISFNDLGLDNLLTFNYKELKYFQDDNDDKRVLVAIYELKDIDIDNLINVIIPKKIIELTLNTIPLTKFTYTKNKSSTKWECITKPDKRIESSLNSEKNISSNTTSIDSYCDIDGNEKIRFYNYDPIQLHITLSKQILKTPIPTPHNIKNFRKALEFLKKQIELIYNNSANKQANLTIDGKDNFFKFS